jgi:transposase
MITMTDFTQIIQMRNKGLTQEQIAQALGISRRSVIRYLKDGHVPVYKRITKSNRIDPIARFYDLAIEKIQDNPSINLSILFEFLCQQGYQGSERTLRRKTADLRRQLKSKEIFFQRQVSPGETMEGDFTEIYLPIAGTKRKVYLWVTSLPYSNTYFARGYYHQTFESFADGSIEAFKHFGGIATKYRLDNMSPAVTAILKGKDRLVTQRFAEFQKHFAFAQDFCNPASGNEKGNVEANNKHLKRKILSLISINNLSFTDLDSFNLFLMNLCQEQKNKVADRLAQENLKPMNPSIFQCFRTEIVSINKFSLFNLGKTGHMYSVPSTYVGLSLEARIYPYKIEVVYNCEVVATHKRLYGHKGLVSIDVAHIIHALAKKPGAMKDWKYRNVLFERPIWIKFYDQICQSKGNDAQYLKCLKLINEYGKDLVTCAMEVAIEEGKQCDPKSLINILSSDYNNIVSVSPIKTNLMQYDEFMKGGTINESASST